MNEEDKYTKMKELFGVTLAFLLNEIGMKFWAAETFNNQQTYENAKLLQDYYNKFRKDNPEICAELDPIIRECLEK